MTAPRSIEVVAKFVKAEEEAYVMKALTEVLAKIHVWFQDIQANRYVYLQLTPLIFMCQQIALQNAIPS
ncbi:hypothetical protein ACH42_08855 [Endozoicomonas sp. (ex Bugula neritina AB1)]|nr:hypothetical protein ACH42_08855 [Endozoicomonas sp. (ex Bugula neritina AB1)]